MFFLFLDGHYVFPAARRRCSLNKNTACSHLHDGICSYTRDGDGRPDQNKHLILVFKKCRHHCHYVRTDTEYLYDSVIYPRGGSHKYTAYKYSWAFMNFIRTVTCMAIRLSFTGLDGRPELIVFPAAIRT